AMTTQEKNVRTTMSVNPTTGTQWQSQGDRETPLTGAASPVGVGGVRAPTTKPGGTGGCEEGAVDAGWDEAKLIAPESTDGVYGFGTGIGLRQTGQSRKPPAEAAGTSTAD